MLTVVQRLALFAGLVGVVVACGNQDTQSGNPAAPCSTGGILHASPSDTEVLGGGPPFTIKYSVLDCHFAGVTDDYSWSSSDTTVILVDSVGTVQPVAAGVAYAMLRGSSEGAVGKVRVAVTSIGAAARRAP